MSFLINSIEVDRKGHIYHGFNPPPRARTASINAYNLQRS